MIDQAKLEKFKDKEYRDAYISHRVRTGIAAQVRALREQFHMTQAEFAERTEKKQSAISRLESTEYGRVTVQTLLDIACKLDVTVVVKFMSHEDFFTHLDAPSLAPKSLRVETFGELSERREGAEDSNVSEGLRRAIGAEPHEYIAQQYIAQPSERPSAIKSLVDIISGQTPFGTKLAKNMGRERASVFEAA